MSFHADKSEFPLQQEWVSFQKTRMSFHSDKNVLTFQQYWFSTPTRMSFLSRISEFPIPKGKFWFREWVPSTKEQFDSKPDERFYSNSAFPSRQQWVSNVIRVPVLTSARFYSHKIESSMQQECVIPWSGVGPGRVKNSGHVACCDAVMICKG